VREPRHDAVRRHYLAVVTAPDSARRPEERRPSLLTVLGLVGATAGWGVGATMTRLAVEELAPLTTTCLRFGLGALLLGEWPGPAQLIGGTLILGGLFVANSR